MKIFKLLFSFTLFWCLAISGVAQTLELGFIGSEENSQPFRILQAIVDTVGEQIGVKFEVISLPGKRATALFLSKQIDGELLRIR